MNFGAAAEPLILAQSPPGGLGQFVPLVMILAVFYFLLIRPQQQRQKEHEELLKDLKRGDNVITQGGLYGTIVEVAEKTVVIDLGQGGSNTNVVKIEREKIAACRDSKKKKKED